MSVADPDVDYWACVCIVCVCVCVCAHSLPSASSASKRHNRKMSQRRNWSRVHLHHCVWRRGLHTAKRLPRARPALLLLLEPEGRMLPRPDPWLCRLQNNSLVICKTVIRLSRVSRSFSTSLPWKRPWPNFKMDTDSLPGCADVYCPCNYVESLFVTGDAGHLVKLFGHGTGWSFARKR